MSSMASNCGKAPASSAAVGAAQGCAGRLSAPVPSATSLSRQAGHRLPATAELSGAPQRGQFGMAVESDMIELYLESGFEDRTIFWPQSYMRIPAQQVTRDFRDNRPGGEIN